MNSANINFALPFLLKPPSFISKKEKPMRFLCRNMSARPSGERNKSSAFS
ncbi:hypothetical protein NW211_02215 [Barnesiella sp. ET7]|nr:hypothetical protein [Barnesiella sp. ET7]